MKYLNYTPLDTNHLIKTHFPGEKRTFDVILLLMGAITATVVIAVGYNIFQQYTH